MADINILALPLVTQFGYKNYVTIPNSTNCFGFFITFAKINMWIEIELIPRPVDQLSHLKQIQSSILV